MHAPAHNIIHELKYGKFWIISDFATTGKGFILTRCMVDALIGIKKLLYRDMLKTLSGKELEKCTKKLKPHHGKVHNHGA